MTTFLQQYILTALWSTNDQSREDGGDPLDDNYTIDDLAPETLEAMQRDCERFQRENEADLAVIDDETQGAHDFWLTRCGHGCGFWDGDWPEPQGARLTKAAKSFGEVWLYVGDDGKIYSSQ